MQWDRNSNLRPKESQIYMASSARGMTISLKVFKFVPFFQKTSPKYYECNICKKNFFNRKTKQMKGTYSFVSRVNHQSKSAYVQADCRGGLLSFRSPSSHFTFSVSLVFM